MSSEAEHGLWSGADPRIVTLRRERDEALAALAVARERAEKAEQERDELKAALQDELDNWNPEVRPTIAAELAVAREREQPMREALEEIAAHDAGADWFVQQIVDIARAALVGETP